MTKLLTATLLLLSTCVPAMAQQVQCMPTGDLVSQLNENYGEYPQMQGIDTGGRLMQIFANEEVGSWTAVIHRPDGVSCAVSSGQEFDTIPQQPNL